MKKIIAVVITLLVVAFPINYFVASPFLKEGDIVFQISKSSQSPYIIAATKSPWSHCGIIVEKNNELYVLEASNRVKLTPYKEWKNRGFLHIVSAKSVLDKEVKVNYKKYLGIPYDLQFKLNNGKYYCSELVWEIYKNQFGIELAKPHPVEDYKITNKKALQLMSRRHIKNSQLIVSPSDIK